MICVKNSAALCLQAAVMSPSVDPSMSLHPSAMITQQMGQLSLGNTGAVSGILGYHTALMRLNLHSVINTEYSQILGQNVSFSLGNL